MATQVEKLVNAIIKVEKVIKKAVADLKKKPGDKKLTEAVRNGMIEIKRLQATYPAAAAADKKYMDKVISEITLK